jgi:tetratricopeptide (TPR) repeat protein
MSNVDSVPVVRTLRRKKSRFQLRKATTVLVLTGLVVVGCGLISQIALWKASLAIERRDNQDAEWWLRIGSWTWQRSGEWYYLSSIVNRRNEDFGKVETSLKAAHQRGWKSEDLERQQLLALAQSGQFTEVGDRWSELLVDAGSDGPEICKSFVNYSLSRFQIAEASTVIDAWKRDFPDDPEAWFVEGRILVVLQRWPDAERVLRQALQRDPVHQKSLKELTIPLMKQLKFPEAEAVAGQALKAEPESAEITASLAHCVLQQGRTDEASEILEAALKRHPSDLGLLAETGRLLLELGKLDQAVTYLNRVVELQPENTELRYALAQALRSLGKEQEAQQHFKLVDEGTRALLQLSRLTSQVVEDPSNVDLRFKVASITWKWKSRNDGEAWLRSVLEYDPKHTGAHKLLAEHYEGLGRKDKAELHRKLAQSE